MKTTISIIKADIGSVGGHICPSQRLLECVKSHVASQCGRIINDFFISHTGDDVAILMTHTRGGQR